MNSNAICNISKQLSKTSEKICSLMDSYNASPETGEVFSELLLDEVRHVQILALELTKDVAEDENLDESAFAEGELNSTVGKEEDDE